MLFRHVPEHVLVPMLKHLLRQVPVRHVLEHVLRHVLKHVLRHVPTKHVYKLVPGHMLEHVPQNRHHDPPSRKHEMIQL